MSLSWLSNPRRRSVVRKLQYEVNGSRRRDEGNLVVLFGERTVAEYSKVGEGCPIEPIVAAAYHQVVLEPVRASVRDAQPSLRGVVPLHGMEKLEARICGAALDRLAVDGGHGIVGQGDDVFWRSVSIDRIFPLVLLRLFSVKGKLWHIEQTSKCGMPLSIC